MKVSIDICKIMVIGCASSLIKIYTQFFEFGFEMLNNDELRLNLQGYMLKY